MIHVLATETILGAWVTNGDRIGPALVYLVSQSMYDDIGMSKLSQNGPEICVKLRTLIELVNY